MALAFILLPAHAALAQQPPGEGPTFRAGIALVKVDAQVVGHNGRVVPGLTKEDFAIFDDGRPQKIAHFGQDAEPLDLVLLLDVSGSMHRHLEQMAATTEAALKQLYPADRVAVVLFAKRAEVREPLTQDLHAVEQEMRDTVHTESLGSGTAINSAVVTVAQYLQKQPPRGRRAVLIVTDNLSLNYRIPDEEVIHELYSADAVLNGMLIGKQRRPDLPKPGQYFNEDFTPSDIFKLAEQSGGEAMEAGKIGESFRHMIERIRARYSIQYAVPPSKPGQFHHIRVELSPEARSRHRSTVVRARAGYYAAP
ncbi:MAG TPA: VWA domain-containing protein [Bryobacteraceae bacterium]|nr:VWA domain-containing protein [Bryobacteraceae bacterium]